VDKKNSGSELFARPGEYLTAASSCASPPPAKPPPLALITACNARRPSAATSNASVTASATSLCHRRRHRRRRRIVVGLAPESARAMFTTGWRNFCKSHIGQWARYGVHRGRGRFNRRLSMRDGLATPAAIHGQRPTPRLPGHFNPDGGHWRKRKCHAVIFDRTEPLTKGNRSGGNLAKVAQASRLRMKRSGTAAGETRPALLYARHAGRTPTILRRRLQILRTR